MGILNKKSLSIVLVFTFVVTLGLTGPTVALAAATAPSLGAATSFSVLTALSASSANTTTLSGDLGFSPGEAVSKTGTWVVGGAEYYGTGGLSETAQSAALGAFNNLAAQTSSGVWSLNASPLPGVWTTATSATFSGPTLTLNGDYDDVWVFQIGSSLTFSGSVVLAGNAQACNVFWQVGADATIASGSNFVGTLIASNNITSASGATINGRLISLNGYLHMDGSNSTISGPTCVAAPAATGSRTGAINVVKNVINDNGRTKTVADFHLFLNGTTVFSGETYDLPASTAYTVTETADPQYTRTFSGDCDSTGLINLNSGDTKFCIVTNNDIGAPVVVPPVPPIIDVVKVPSPLSLPGGPGPVTYTYTLRNIGIVPATDVTMVGDTCSPITLISGDTNSDAKLDLAETWVYRCSTTLAETHTNTVVATGWANGISATDIASATVVVGLPIVPPLIHITKVPAPLTLLAGGGAVTYTNKVTNPGTVALSNVIVADDKCSSVKYVSGDINGDSKLDTTETWTYTCSMNLAQTTVNTATATGEANGLIARDFAIATVVVAAAVPKLPNTGLPFTGSSLTWGIIILAGIFTASILFVITRKKQII